MPKEPIYKDETRVQVPVKNPVLEIMKEDAGETPVGRHAAAIIHKHYAPKLRKTASRRTKRK